MYIKKKALSNLNAFLAHLKNTYGGGGSRSVLLLKNKKQQITVISMFLKFYFRQKHLKLS
ncbi:hypothetical protein ABT59_08930 [Enterococcus cecorum]|nr:hypothetical protein ABT59_08930 [Enterococcus cecorum]